MICANTRCHTEFIPTGRQKYCSARCQTNQWHNNAYRKAHPIDLSHAPKSPEQRAKISAAQKGRSVTPATRAKLREALTGKVRPLDVRLKIAKGNKGKLVSDETREKMRAAKIGKPLTVEHRQKLSAGQHRRQRIAIGRQQSWVRGLARVTHA